MKREEKQIIINLALEEYLNTPEKERSLTKIGNKYGVKRQTLSTHLKKRGIEVINYQNRLRINENVFNEIDTEEKAYWLGFLYADGNISSIGNRLEINLAIKDLDHMIKFKNFIQYEEEIRFGETNGHKLCRLAIRNKNIWKNLNSKGCTPCKSLTLKFPKIEIFEDKNLIWDFIRGYFDGDGCAYLNETRNQLQVDFVGTKEFLSSLKEFLNLSDVKIINKSSLNYENKAFRLRYSKKFDIDYIYDKFYSNATIYLERKKLKFDTYYSAPVI